MTRDELLELEWAANHWPAVPSAAMLRVLSHLNAVLREKEKLSQDCARLQTRLSEVQGSLVHIIQQLQDCRDTEAAVLKLVMDAQDRKEVV